MTGQTVNPECRITQVLVLSVIDTALALATAIMVAAFRSPNS